MPRAAQHFHRMRKNFGDCVKRLQGAPRASRHIHDQRCPRTPASARESAARGFPFRPLSRIASPIPGKSFVAHRHRGFGSGIARPKPCAARREDQIGGPGIRHRGQAILDRGAVIGDNLRRDISQPSLRQRSARLGRTGPDGRLGPRNH